MASCTSSLQFPSLPISSLHLTMETTQTPCPRPPSHFGGKTMAACSILIFIFSYSRLRTRFYKPPFFHFSRSATTEVFSAGNATPALSILTLIFSRPRLRTRFCKFSSLLYISLRVLAFFGRKYHASPFYTNRLGYSYYFRAFFSFVQCVPKLVQPLSLFE